MSSLPRRIVLWSALALSTALILQLVVWSVSFRWHFPALLPESLSLRAWRLLNINNPIAETMATSVLLSLSVTALNILIAVPAALYIHLLRHRRAKLFADICVILPLLVPPLAVITGGYQGLARIGLTDTIAGVILVHLLPTIPYMIIIMRAVLSNIDFNYLSTARTLGASARKTCIRVLIPLMLPGLITGAFFVFLISWSQYLPTLIVGGGRVMTIPILLFAYASAGDLAVMAMFSVLLVAPTLILLAVNAKYITGKAFYARD